MRVVKPGVLMAGLNPVCTDAVATAVMGYNPRADARHQAIPDLRQHAAAGGRPRRGHHRSEAHRSARRLRSRRLSTATIVSGWLTQKGTRGSYRVFRLESWETFFQLVTKPPYSHWAFRGERDERWPLYSSLSRYLRNFGVDPEAWPEQEARILRIFKRKAHQFLAKPPDLDDDFQWLALMQHHGAPTRLIDFTWSPYVAAFFALERTLADGVVWAMNPARINSSRAPGARRMDPRTKRQFPALFSEGRSPVHLDGRTAHYEPAADRAIGHLLPCPACWTCRSKRYCIRTDQENILAKIVLANAVRETAMRELYRMNITYATLFPDLDGLAKSMRYELEFHWAYNPRTMEKYRA